MQTKIRIAVALIIAIVTLMFYPTLNSFAIMERGYDAFGGEELLTIVCLIAAVWIFPRDAGKKCKAARPKANRPTTESEQSNNHFDA